MNTAATEETEKHYSRQQNAFFKIENFKTGWIFCLNQVCKAEAAFGLY